MKLKYAFETVDMGEEIISVPVGKGAKQVQGVLKLNKEGQEIMDLLRSSTTEDEVVSALGAKYENSQAQISQYVHSFVAALRNSGLIEE